jgi:hypothetical protein
LVDKAFVLAKRHYWAITRLGLIPFLASMTIALFIGPHRSLAVRYALTVPIYAGFGVMEAITVVGAWQALHGQAIAPGPAWRMVRRRIGGAVATYVLKSFLAVFGLALLIIPGLYVWLISSRCRPRT